MGKAYVRYSLVLLTGLALVGAWALSSDVTADPLNTDEVRIAGLVQEMEGMNQDQLYKLQPVEVTPFEIPDDSVDVMRARLTETYIVDGVGEDTVELTGWVAVKHFNARPKDGEVELNWDTVVLDTQFVGLKLAGHSDLFGPVEVNLDKTRPVSGQVGRIDAPKYAIDVLDSILEKDATLVATTSRESAPADNTIEPVDESAVVCEAEVNVAIAMPELGLNLRTANPVVWYSKVDTIPPVGHAASVAVEPVRLMDGDREVATLVSGRVNFREVVRQVWLDTPSYSSTAVAP